MAVEGDGQEEEGVKEAEGKTRLGESGDGDRGERVKVGEAPPPFFVMSLTIPYLLIPDTSRPSPRLIYHTLPITYTAALRHVAQHPAAVPTFTLAFRPVYSRQYMYPVSEYRIQYPESVYRTLTNGFLRTNIPCIYVRRYS